jgi:hypothetical protein
MKSQRVISFAAILSLLPTASALAETGARQDNSQFLVWAFLGMCAMIVILQLVPVAVLAFGLVKGLLKGKDEEVVEEVAAHK